MFVRIVLGIVLLCGHCEKSNGKISNNFLKWVCLSFLPSDLAAFEGHNI